MARGLLSGFVVGAAVSVCVAAVASFYAGPPASPDLRVDVAEEGVEPPISAELSGPIPARGEGEAPAPDAPAVDVPERDEQSKLGVEALRPAGRPEAGEPNAAVTKPAPMAEPGGFAVGGDAPVAADRQVLRPSTPDGDEPAETQSERPRPPGSGLNSSGPGGAAGLRMPEAELPDSPVMPGADPARRTEAGTPAAPGALEERDTPDVLAGTAPRPDTDPAGPTETRITTDVSEAPVTPVPADPGDGRTTADRSTPPDLAQASEREPAPDTGALPPVTGSARGSDPVPNIAALPQAGPADLPPDRGAPAIGTPATSLLQRAPDAGAPVDESQNDAREEPDAAQDPAAPAPAIVTHAEPFEATAGEPLLSIILMDTGQDLEQSPVGLAALRSFPYELSFAVDTSLADANERAETYRSAGYEVLAMVDLPRNLTAADTEVALTASLARVPQAVGVLEGPGSGLQGSPEMAAQVTAILEETGHGIVWQPSGLDAAQRLASRAGVASQTLFRDFDSGDQTPVVIRRFLDHAAFKAGQEGSIIMVGRIRPDTISALLVWGLQDRAQRVVVAPISTTLLADQQSG